MIQLKIGGTDVSRYLAPNSLSITDQINVPTTCTFMLVNEHATFPVPQQGEYVTVYSTLYGKYLFTGFVVAPPVQQYQGVNALAPNGLVWQFHVTCTSDEYLLNNKVPPFIPAFVNQTQGQILARIAEALAPGYFDVTSFVASGDLVPYFQFDPTKNWSELAKEWADASRYRYKFLNKKFYFQPYGDAALGIAYDEDAGERTFDPYALQLGNFNQPLLNDVVVIGVPEAGSFAQAYFLGDGFNTVFPLNREVFRGETNLLLQEDWTGTSFDTSKWIIQDPQNDFTLYQGALNVLGGVAEGSSYIVGNNGVELGGQLHLQIGDFTFTGPSTGLIGGLYTGSVPTLANCFVGFAVYATDGVTTLQPVLNGAGLGPVITLKETDHSYQLLMDVSSNQQVRYTRKFRAVDWSAEYGGLEQPSGGAIRWQVFDTDMTASIQQAEAASATVGPIILPPPAKVLDWWDYVSEMPAFAVFCPINSQDLHCSLTSTLLAQPPQATLQTSVGAASGSLQWQPKTLGFGLLSQQDATITQGTAQQTSSLQFYADDIPPEEQLIWLRFRVAQRAMARVVDVNSIAVQAALAGDDGHRGAIMSSMSPAPRTSEEAEAAAAAQIRDAETQYFQGSYSVKSPFWDSTGSYPVTGRYLAVNAPSQGVSSQKLLVKSVTTVVLESFQEMLSFQVSFGPDPYLNKFLSRYLPLQNVLAPQDTATMPTLQDISQVGSSFLTDLDNVQLVSVDSTSAVLDVGVAPASGIEVRLTDLGWGTTGAIGRAGLLGRYTNQQITVQRNHPSETFYLRMVDGAKTSRRTTLVQINVPTIPLAPTGVVIAWINQNQPQFTVVLPEDIQNIQGVEIRDVNGAVVFHRDWLTQSDLVFIMPALIDRNAVFYAYTYNLIGGFSNPWQIDIGNPRPGVSQLAVDEKTSALTWTAVGNPIGYRIDISGTGRATFEGSVAAGTTAMSFALLGDDLLANRTFTVTALDIYGDGDGQTISHQHAPQAVTAFGVPGQILVLPAPGSPTVGPAIPTEFGNDDQGISSRSWFDYGRTV